MQKENFKYLEGVFKKRYAIILEKTEMKRIGVFVLLGLLIWSCNTTNNKDTKELTKVQIDSLQGIQCDSLLKDLSKAKADTFGRVKYIPTNFEGCINQLDSLTSDKMKEWIKCLPDCEFSRFVHHGFGMYLRNSWGLWGDTKLARNLYEMGILHPDDMTGIILDSYQRKLKGENIKLEEQLKYYQDFWRKNGTPVDSILQTLKNKKNNGYTSFSSGGVRSKIKGLCN